MAVSENTGGNQTADSDTEHTLATITVAGVYQLGVDLSNMVEGDELELRIKVKLRSASSSKVAFFAAFAHDAGADGAIVYSPPIAAPFEIICTLKQVTGTGRSYDWSIYEYGNA